MLTLLMFDTMYSSYIKIVLASIHQSQVDFTTHVKSGNVSAAIGSAILRPATGSIFSSWRLLPFLEIVSVGVRKMADGDIDLYADDLEQDFAQVIRTSL